MRFTTTLMHWTLLLIPSYADVTILYLMKTPENQAYLNNKKKYWNNLTNVQHSALNSLTNDKEAIRYIRVNRSYEKDRPWKGMFNIVSDTTYYAELSYDPNPQYHDIDEEIQKLQ